MGADVGGGSPPPCPPPSPRSIIPGAFPSPAGAAGASFPPEPPVVRARWRDARGARPAQQPKPPGLGRRSPGSGVPPCLPKPAPRSSPRIQLLPFDGTLGKKEAKAFVSLNPSPLCSWVFFLALRGFLRCISFSAEVFHDCLFHLGETGEKGNNNNNSNNKNQKAA